MVARAICVLARATCYLVRAIFIIARAMLFSSAETLEIAIYLYDLYLLYNMTTHFQFGSNYDRQSNYERHSDLLLFRPFFLSFSIFMLLHFPFCITAGTGVL